MFTVKSRMPMKVPINVVGRGGGNVGTIAKPRFKGAQGIIVKRTVSMSPPKVSMLPIETVTYLVGKGVILFTMFYCGLNWLYYRELNKQNDNDDEVKR